jgi:hypothetical protein
VTDVVVKALGSEWHANCFCCLVSCISPFRSCELSLFGHQC